VGIKEHTKDDTTIPNSANKLGLCCCTGCGSVSGCWLAALFGGALFPAALFGGALFPAALFGGGCTCTCAATRMRGIGIRPVWNRNTITAPIASKNIRS